MMHRSSTRHAVRCGASLGMAGLAAFLAVVTIPLLCPGEELAATIAIESQEVFLGEPFAFQVKVSGADKPGKPDLSGLSDFAVRELGESRSGQSSFTVVVNGRQIQSSSTSDTIFNYELVARKDGLLTIPSIAVTAQGTIARTQPVQIKVSRPVETDDFKLRLTISKTRCYVGEPVIMKIVWYIGTRVGNYQLSVPVLENDAFAFADPSDGQASIVQIGGGTVAAVQGRAELNGRQYDAVEFSKVLIPRKAGTFTIPAATVSCAVLAGRQKQKSPFGEDFPFQDAFFSTTRDVYKKVIVPSEDAALEVIPVPAPGRPANFAGHIGEYKIAASATPQEVSVGDPITLTVVLSGPEYLEKVELPPLGDQPALARDFKISTEIAPGKVGGGAKVFTQSIRALREDVQFIPPIELNYFDTKSGLYGVARSEPIPLKVKATRVVTSGMGVGGEPVVASSALEAWGKGIAHNYEDVDMLVDQRSGPVMWIRSPLWISILAAPPLTCFAVFALAAVARRRKADPMSMKARRALGEFTRACREAGESKSAESSILLDAMRTYLGSKLRIPSAAMSYKDVESLLTARAVDKETLSALRGFFERCEEDSYAGGSSGRSQASALARSAQDIADRMECKLR